MNVLRARRPDAASTVVVPEEDPATAHLRDESDPDPLVEALTARLRKQFPASLSCDEWGRPVAYRHVVRAALSALPPHVTRELAERLGEHGVPTPVEPQTPDAQDLAAPQPSSPDLESLLPVAYIDLDQPMARVDSSPLPRPAAHGVGWPEWSPAV